VNDAANGIDVKTKFVSTAMTATARLLQQCRLGQVHESFGRSIDRAKNALTL
jgi:hypothetical protein